VTQGGSEVSGGEEVAGELVEASGEAAPVLDAADEVLDLMRH